MIGPRSSSLVGIALFLAPLAGLAVRAAAQAPQAPPSPPSVTFQTEVNYVDVDASVTDEEGRFVTGLTKDDFEISEDGKPQKIDSLSLVEIPVERQDRFLVLNQPVYSDVRTNQQPFAGRVYVIVLDDLDVSILRTVQARRAARDERAPAQRSLRARGGHGAARSGRGENAARPSDEPP